MDVFLPHETGKTNLKNEANMINELSLLLEDCVHELLLLYHYIFFYF